MSYKIVCDDVLDWAAGYEGEKFHAVLCDPPYELAFMGKSWDDSGIPFKPSTWAAIAEHLHPGGFILAFGGSRTYHRLACAVEDAGLIVHPALVWLNGQGFPKATRIDTQLDKANGRKFEDRYALGRHIKQQREALGYSRADVNGWFGYADGCSHWERQDPHGARVPTLADWKILKDKLQLSDNWTPLVQRIEAEREVIGTSEWSHQMGIPLPNTYNGERQHLEITAPATPLAATWAGHRYGLQALKPCAEFILCAQKPYSGKPVDSIVATGAGALWIDGARVHKDPDDKSGFQKQEEAGQVVNGMLAYQKLIHSHGYRPYEAGLPAEKNKESQHEWNKGRWPPNVALTHLEGCRRVGVKRVRGEGGRNIKGNSKGSWFGPDNGKRQKYHDPDGTEQVDDFECVEGCAVAALDGKETATMVAQNVFLQYNVGKQEVQPCCENASIATVNLMLDHLMSSKDLGDFAVENVAMPANETKESVTPGGGKTSEPQSVVVGIDAGESQETAESINSLNTDGSGKWNTDQSQAGMMSTTLMETVKITTCPICDSSLHLGITIYTNGDGKITELSQMEPKQDAASDASNTSRSPNSLSVKREHITATVKIVPVSICGNGTRSTQVIGPNITKNGGHEKNNVSRFYPQSSWEYEIEERLASVTPFMYQSKAGRRERNAGLSRFVWKRDGGDHKRIQSERAIDEFWRWQQFGLPGKGFDDWLLNAEGKVREVSKIPYTWGNIHPTQKPIALCKWLASLILPPAEYAPRRLLIPFFGKGSEGAGALLAGWESITGIEQDQNYCDAGEARCRFWAGWAGRGHDDPKLILKEAAKEAKKQPEPQLELDL